nr:PPE family protein [Mycobacterium pseudoshottsii]
MIWPLTTAPASVPSRALSGLGNVGDWAARRARRIGECGAASPRAPALLISRLVSWVDDLWCRAIGAGV